MAVAGDAGQSASFGPIATAEAQALGTLGAATAQRALALVRSGAASDWPTIVGGWIGGLSMRWWAPPSY